jgi:hypothetical protein
MVPLPHWIAAVRDAAPILKAEVVSTPPPSVNEPMERPIIHERRAWWEPRPRCDIYLAGGNRDSSHRR